MHKLLFWATIILLASSGCVKYNAYEIRLSSEEKGLTNKNIAKIQAQPLSDTLTFVFAGDAQRFYDEAIYLVQSINNDPTIDFVLFAGDISDFGLAEEFQGMNSIFAGLNVPYVVVIGNHDLIYNGGEVYHQMFGDYNFSFMVGDYKFVVANTNSREFAFNGKVPDINWIQSQLNDTAHYFGAVILVHVPPGNDDFDNTLEWDFANALSKPGKTIMELHGHNHGFSDNYPYNGDIRYLNSYSLNNRKYLKIKLWKGITPNQSHKYSVVNF